MSNALVKIIINTMRKHDGLRINNFNTTILSTLADYIIICSAVSERHASTLANKIVWQMKQCGTLCFSVEGNAKSGWILIDFLDIIVHIMLPDVRNFYNLEELWSM
ncbi:ribosome silencing factor [Coxiella endosymbiont of Amblyomma americanum]|uniref:ribosome silencing factor n=1 Tax=Coxiella endosymbiont of Amblyomma americanum TaxID=325775 RepID=UPI00057E2A42|nr:ribosome silencing factor [Coxiella endosymbiont of Amblyomma americanum]AUJ58968.1 ribosome silencing factor RsfS [Coxiella-like endosymbiont of Amblyomma americanum]